MNQSHYVLAGDVGGTNLRIAAVDNDGGVLHLSSVATPATRQADEILRAVVAGAEACISAVGGERPIAFGLALPALVDSTAGRILSSPNLPDVDGVDLRTQIAEGLRLAVALENDATAAAIGEHWLGSTIDAQNSIFVTLGTGVGGGLILNGEPYRGVDGTAGEVGHICVVTEGVACGCGSRGCIEQYASATAIARIASEISQASAHPRFYANSKEVYIAAHTGDEVANEAFRVMGTYLGQALAGLVDVLNPEIIAIGGGAAGAWDVFSKHVRAEIDARAFRHPAERVKLVHATLGGHAGILGAARVALDTANLISA